MMKHWYESDLGINCDKLLGIASAYRNSTFVDLGVRTGISSDILLHKADERNNFVYGVDVSFNMCGIENNTPRYTKILGDSVTVGKNWNRGKIDGLFVDTLHIKEQVMCELKYWWKHLNNKSFIVFHDSNWPTGKRDVINGISYDRVEDGIKSFFGVNEVNHEDDYIKMKTYPESWGMTIVEVKQKIDYPSQYKNWRTVLETRNKFICDLFTEDNQNGIVLERLIKDV